MAVPRGRDQFLCQEDSKAPPVPEEATLAKLPLVLVLDWNRPFNRLASSGGGMLAATVVVLVLALRAFYLNVKVGRVALIRRSGRGLLHVELRRCVYLEQLPAYISQFPWGYPVSSDRFALEFYVDGFSPCDGAV